MFKLDELTVPDGWKKKHVKHLLTSDGIKIGPFGSALKLDTLVEEGIKVYGQGNVIKNDFSIGHRHLKFDDFEKSFSQYELKTGDVLVTMMGTTGKSKVFREEYKRGIIDSHLLRLRFRNKTILPELFATLLEFGDYIFHQIKLSSKGSIMEGLNSSIVKNIVLLLPPIEEQKLITQYLDKKTSQIDLLVNKIQEKIELLKERRTSLINHCVTKGLDPNVEMKDSGVEWIGEIPKHWEVTRLKYHGEVLIGLSFDKDDMVDEAQGTLVLRSSNVQNGRVNFSDNVWVKTEVPEKLFVQQGDILICSRNGSRHLIGKNCLLGHESLGMTWGVFMSVFRSRHSEFFYWVLNSQVFKSQSGLFLTSTINQLTVSTLENLVFPFVSDPNEQHKINELLKRETKSIDELIDKEQRRISLLREYRQSLISSVVTGQVRITEDMV